MTDFVTNQIKNKRNRNISHKKATLRARAESSDGSNFLLSVCEEQENIDARKNLA